MTTPNLGPLRAVSDRLEGLGLNYAFVGGAIVNLLTDNPGFAPARPTDDIDVIMEVLTSERYSSVEARIRALGFEHDMREGAPLCRWILGNLTVDIMPTEADVPGSGKSAAFTPIEDEAARYRPALMAQRRCRSWSAERPTVHQPAGCA